MLGNDSFRSLKTSLLAGQYNLLFGAGISLNSKSHLGEYLPSAESLRQHLCELKAVRETTSLSRVYGLLDKTERKQEITERFSGCAPSKSLIPMTRFLWKRLFTFNVDDVIQNLYTNCDEPKQTLITKNFDDSFEPDTNKSELLTVHLHGWVKNPESKYVFTHNEYARVMKDTNPWMMILGQILATEPFIVAGTSLDEVDLEFYLQKRTKETLRKERGPSLLIEPNADAATRKDCEKYGLILVEETFQDFLNWLCVRIPAPPGAAELLIPDIAKIFPDIEDNRTLVKFFTDFRVVKPSTADQKLTLSGFFYGSPPTEDDYYCHADIQRDNTQLLFDDVKQRLESPGSSEPQMVILLGEAGAGKTTILGRISHDLARTGIPVFAAKALAKLDLAAAEECFSSLSMKAVLIVDGIADYIEQIVDLLYRSPAVRTNLVILGAERMYRKEHIDRILANMPALIRQVSETSDRERLELMNRYQRFGLIGTREALNQPEKFVQKLAGEPIAVSVCRLLNDFNPLRKIIDSLWEACPHDLRLAYLAAVIARHCYSGGVKYALLQDVMGIRSGLSDLFVREATSLELADNLDNTDYVVPASSLIAEQILRRAKGQEPELMQEAFLGLATVLAPSVNRIAIMRRTPEARLAGRLFDSDSIALPLLGAAATTWYEQCHDAWCWNSRYWEQRALLVLEDDFELATRYARYAVAVEKHPLSLTTLAKVLISQMDAEPSAAKDAFCEIIELVDTAIQMERNRARISIHPFGILLSAADKAKKLGLQLDVSNDKKLKWLVESANNNFGYDRYISDLIGKLG